MSGLLFFGFISSSFTGAIFAATVMMAIAGLVTAIVMSRVPVASWRLQSFLVAAVLLQGLMLVRVPVNVPVSRGWTQLQEETQAIGESAAPITEIDLEAAELASAAPASSVTTALPQQVSRSLGWWPKVDWSALSWETLLTIAWLGGAILLVVWSLVNYLRMLRLIRKLQRAPEAWQRQWDRVTAGRDLQMLVSESVGPLMIRRPQSYALIVPETYWHSLSEAQRRAVMLHELAHVDRYDVWRQLVARAIATLHWFNPVAWWAMWRYEQASELACDWRVAKADPQTSASFASALVQLVDWHQQAGIDTPAHRGIGLQAMAAPPLTSRITRLLHPQSNGDSNMKRFALALFALAVMSVAFIQVRLTAADGESDSGDTQANLSVLPESVDNRLAEIIGQLDQSDETTARLATLAESTSGKLAIGAYLNALRNRELQDARLEAVPRFLQRHFTKTDEGKYQTREDQKDVYARWEKKTERLADAFGKLGAKMGEIASRLDEENDADLLMYRFLNDAQAPAALMLFDQKGGGDLITQFISKAFGDFLVDRGDGSFQIVESKRGEAEEKIKKLEAAGKIRKKLLREFPLWADELDTSDASHKKFADYLKKPMTASVVSVVLIQEHQGNPALAVEELFNNLEKSSVDTPKGLRITAAEAWQKLEEIYDKVDRLGGMVPRMQERLAEVADTLSKDDQLESRLAKILGDVPVALLLAAEFPYADADPGKQLESQLSTLLEENADGKLTIGLEKRDEVSKKMQELLRVCRAVRRHMRTVQEVMEMIDDEQLVSNLGHTGIYVLLSEIRRSSESIRPDPIALMAEDLLAQTEKNRLRVREERREIVRQMVEQAEKVRDQEANDDF